MVTAFAVPPGFASWMPLGHLFPDLIWPEDQFEGGTGLLDRVIATGWSFTRGMVEVGLYVDAEIVLALPTVEGLELALRAPDGSDGTGLSFGLRLQYDVPTEDGTGGWVLTIVGAAVTLRFDTTLLRAMEDDGQGGFVETGEPVAVTFTGDVTVTHEWALALGTDVAVSLGFVQLGSTGVIVSAEEVVPYFGVGPPPAMDGALVIGEDFRGLYIGEATVHLPGAWSGRASDAYTSAPTELTTQTDSSGRTITDEDGAPRPLPPDDPVYVGPRITFSQCTIGTGGFSGDVVFDVDASTDLGDEPLANLVAAVDPGDRLEDASAGVSGLSAELLGFGLALQRFELSLRRNVVTASTIGGALRVPFLDTWFDVEVTLSGDGAFDIGLSTESGAPLIDVTITDVLQLVVTSVRIEDPGGDDPVAVIVDGSVTPLLDVGAPWPTLEVAQLHIFADGTVQVPGGWMKLPTQYAVDFFGFQMELAALGFGTGPLTEDAAGDWRWIGLSGTLRLVDELAVAGSVEGLRIGWRPLSGGGFEWDWSLEGIGVEAATDAFSFNGAVRLLDDPDTGQGFAGAVALSLTALGLAFEAEFVVGRTAPAPDGYAYWGVLLGVDLPAGIPLGPTGIAFYGLKGLGSQNLTPDITPLEDWYDGWYKRRDLSGRSGVTLAKHLPSRGALGFGLGVTLGTAPDNGFTVNTKALAVLLFPGPTIMFAGKAAFLSPRAALDGTDEPPFESLLVIDGGDGSVLLNIAAEYPLIDERVLDIAGEAEAYFSASDVADWHLHLGRRPLEERISVTALSLFSALGYLQIDQTGLATGFRIGYGDSYRFGRLALTLDVHMSGDGVISFAPATVAGRAELAGSFEACAFGVCLGIAASAGVTVRAFTPLSVSADLSVEVDLPTPLPTLSAPVSLSWRNEERPDYVDPFIAIRLVHPRTAEEWIPATSESAAPSVPMDARPVITFSRPVADPQMLGQPAAYVTAPLPEPVGDHLVTYTLTDVALEFRSLDGQWLPVDDLYAVWLLMGAAPAVDPAEAEIAGARTTTKLEVWGRTPFSYEDHTTVESVSQAVVDDPTFPCGPYVWLEDTCVDWTDVPLRTRYPYLFEHENLRFLANRMLEVAAEPALGAGGEADRCLAIPPGTAVLIALPGPCVDVTLAVETLATCQVQAWGRSDPTPTQLDSATVLVRSAEPVHFDTEGIEWLVLIAEDAPECDAWAWEDLDSDRWYDPDVLPPDRGHDPVPDDPALHRPVTAIPCCSLLYKVCWLERATVDAVTDRRARRAAFAGWTETWTGSGRIFGPNTSYRMTATVEATGMDSPATFTRTAYVRTQGPPGFLADDPDGKGALLSTLSLYVERMSPPAGAGSSAALPAHYRDHDIVVLYAGDAVKELYAGRLFLEVVDANGVPVAGAGGRTRFEADFTDPAHRALTTGETIFVDAFVESDCSKVTTADVRPDDSQGFSVPTLAPATLYTARLLGGWSAEAGLDAKGEVVVEPRTLEFTEVHSWEFVTSQHLDFAAHLATFDAARGPWDGPDALDGVGGFDDAAVAALLAAVQAGGAAWDEDEKLAADELLRLVGAPSRPASPRVDVTVVRDRPRAVGVLIDAGEPLDWPRITATVSTGGGAAVPHVLVRARDGRRALVFRTSDGATLDGLAAARLVVTLTYDLAVTPSRYADGASGIHTAELSIRIAPEVVTP